jgi:hypothetical protein
MSGGTNELSRAATAYVACFTFVLTYVLTVLRHDGMTAMFRATVVAVITLIVGRLLFRPLITSILDGIAQHEVARNKARREDR